MHTFLHCIINDVNDGCTATNAVTVSLPQTPAVKIRFHSTKGEIARNHSGSAVLYPNIAPEGCVVRIEYIGCA